MVRGLAEYEREPHAVEMTEDVLERVLFGTGPAVFCHVADDGGHTVGFALWYVSFSTWTGGHGIYLEDLFVRPAFRGRGHGRSLIRELAKVCAARGYRRLEWSVLRWNEPALAFYNTLGAAQLDEWVTERVDGAALHALAAADPSKDPGPGEDSAL
jgi:GNAT superfamily N-acetyltransferase